MTKGTAMFTGFGITLTEEEAIKSSFWYLQYQGGEHGPFKFEEMTKLLGSKRLLGKIHFWRPGLVHWMPVEIDRQDLTPPSILIQNAIALYEKIRRRKLLATASANLSIQRVRRDERQGFVGSVFTVSASGRRRYLGTCLDLSRRGAGIMLEKEVAECPAGSELVLEIVPISCCGISPFQVRGEVRWSNGKTIGVDLTDGLGAEMALGQMESQRKSELLAAETAFQLQNSRW
jgi:hypothetical protein